MSWVPVPVSVIFTAVPAVASDNDEASFTVRLLVLIACRKYFVFAVSPAGRTELEDSMTTDPVSCWDRSVPDGKVSVSELTSAVKFSNSSPP